MLRRKIVTPTMKMFHQKEKENKKIPASQSVKIH